MSRFALLMALIPLAHAVFAQEKSAETSEAPLPESQVVQLVKSFEKSLNESAIQIKENPKSPNGYSQHGDACFCLGQFQEAVSDYDKMIELDESQRASHWRRGIGLFYAERYEDAAAQFESYHSFDQIDRENGIWRYLSQHRAYGREKARRGLLKYQKDDREPFPSVYKLFAGVMTSEQILKEITDADVSKTEREKRLFYANLYIGLNEAVEGDTSNARLHLASATRNRWAITAGYGPNFMWHVGRLHEEQLRKKNSHQ